MTRKTPKDHYDHNYKYAVYTEYEKGSPERSNDIKGEIHSLHASYKDATKRYLLLKETDPAGKHEILQVCSIETKELDWHGEPTEHPHPFLFK